MQLSHRGNGAVTCSAYGSVMDELRDLLLAEAFLYDQPESFIAGVDAALQAVARTTQGSLSTDMSLLQQRSKLA